MDMELTPVLIAVAVIVAGFGIWYLRH